jgi:winged helix DNA-binding protein
VRLVCCNESPTRIAALGAGAALAPAGAVAGITLPAGAGITMARVADDDVRRWRLHAQRLIDPPPAGPAEVVRAMVAIQAQDRRAAPLAVRVRAPGVTAETVDQALREGSVVRSWAMRGTLHLLAADDVPLALAVFAPVLHRLARRRLVQLGVPPNAANRGVEEATAVLAEEGPLTRHELAGRLRARGIPVTEGQAPRWMVYRAVLEGVLREVGVRGREELYGRIDLGPLPDRDEALQELGRRYAAAHAPAVARDFAVWSRLPAADVRRAWAGLDESAGASPPGTAGWSPPPVRLLPAFDEWLLGWGSREFTLPPEHARKVLPGGGIIRPVVIADGRVVATWRLDRTYDRIEVAPFDRIDRATNVGLDAEAAAIGAFLGAHLSLDIAAR